MDAKLVLMLHSDLVRDLGVEAKLLRCCALTCSTVASPSTSASGRVVLQAPGTSDEMALVSIVIGFKRDESQLSCWR